MSENTQDSNQIIIARSDIVTPEQMIIYANKLFEEIGVKEVVFNGKVAQ